MGKKNTPWKTLSKSVQSLRRWRSKGNRVPEGQLEMALAQTKEETPAPGRNPNPNPRPSPRPHIGYLTCRSDGLTGTQGIGYDYIVAGNGLFVQASNQLLTVRTLIAHAQVRGLLEVQPKVEPAHGRIPAKLFELGLRWMQTEPGTERFFAIWWNGKEYRLAVPEQTGTSASLTYKHQQTGGTIAEFHSHGRLSAFFSGTDDEDEQGFRVYGVIGKTGNEIPELTLRTGIYGHHAPALWKDIFDGPSPCQEPKRRAWAKDEREYERDLECDIDFDTAKHIIKAMRNGAFP